MKEGMWLWCAKTGTASLRRAPQGLWTFMRRAGQWTGLCFGPLYQYHPFLCIHLWGSTWSTSRVYLIAILCGLPGYFSHKFGLCLLLGLQCVLIFFALPAEHFCYLLPEVCCWHTSLSSSWSSQGEQWERATVYLKQLETGKLLI